MDANINRAREGIRVIEETSRMLFNDGELTKRIKNVRHSLVKICKTEKGIEDAMIFARGSENDVLREGETESEKSRPGLNAIVRANASRAQEAFRALEEYTKLTMPHLSGEFKALRFDMYDIEKALVSLIRVNAVTAEHRLKFCVVIDIAVISGDAEAEYLPTLTKTILGSGAGSLIYRDRISGDADFMRNAVEIMNVCGDRDVSVFIESRLDVAMIVRADGIILGHGDITPESCRKIAGMSLAIGISDAADDNPADIIDPNAHFYITGDDRKKESSLMDALKNVEETVSVPNVPILISVDFLNGFPTEKKGEEIAALLERGAKGILLTPDYSQPGTVAGELRQIGEMIGSCPASM
jgi:thiamine monophosphate synthase